MKATHNPDLNKGGIVVDQILSGGTMLEGGKLQSIHEESTVQNYDIGTRLVMDDRVFRYCKAGMNLKELIGGLCGMSQIEVNTHATASLEGTFEVTVLDVAARDKDHYAGGYLWIMKYAPATTGIGTLYRIKGSEESTGTSVKLTLWEPLIYDCEATTWITVWASIYGNIQDTLTLTKCSLVCMPLIEVATGSYFWGQTWGPCFMQCGASPGTIAYDRDLYYKSAWAGCLPGSEIDFSTLGNAIPQRVGFLLPNTAVIGTDNFFMLQLSP